MKFKNILRVHRTMKHEERNMALEHLKIHRRTLHEYRFWRNRTCIDEIYRKMENLFPPLKTKLFHFYCLFSYMLQFETKITKLRNKTSYTKGSLQKIKRAKLGTFAKQGGGGSDQVGQMSQPSYLILL